MWSHDPSTRTSSWSFRFFYLNCIILTTAIMANRMTTADFIRRAKEVFGDKYDYSKVNIVNNRTKVSIICRTHGEYWQSPFSHLLGHGCKTCFYSAKTLYGIGVKDLDVPQEDVSYIKWSSMFVRCYSDKFHEREPTYKECEVCSEWHKLSNFKRWFDKNYIPGYHLDKDLLIQGNKIYSPDTCCFIPEELNKMLNTRSRFRGAYPIGVTKARSRYKSSIMINGHKISIGTFDTPQEAFLAYKNRKERLVKELAEKYFKEGKITERVYIALMKYEVEITD